MSILNRIVEAKRAEVREQQELYPVKLLEKSIFYNSPAVSLSYYIKRKDLWGIIAEFKRKSPSGGILNEFAKPSRVCLDYMRAGASALSVVTDKKFFAGNRKDLKIARKYNYCPVLCKDFIIDEYQVHEARSYGADAILLIADILTGKEMKKLADLARSLSMEVLFEIHSRECIARLPSGASIIGINNRNLNDFSVDHKHSIELIDMLPPGTIKIAESGIDSPEKYLKLKEAGFDGFLIGSHFMESPDPGRKCEKFIRQVIELESRSDNNYSATDNTGIKKGNPEETALSGKNRS